MGIIGGLDVHRSQITYDWIDTDSGQRQRGQLAPAHREHLRVWLGQFAGQQAAFAVEGCTGWRYVVEELGRAGIAAHLAEPADTSAARGPKRRAKTDQLDARHLRELLAAGRLPESWIPPGHVLEVRTLVRCYKALTDEHTAWLQRVHATLFHHGAPAERNLLAPDRRARLEREQGYRRPPASWSRWRWAPWTTWTPSWTGCGPSWSALPAGSRAARRWTPCTASAR
jgi:transposase